jgi:hypothetical protein
VLGAAAGLWNNQRTFGVLLAWVAGPIAVALIVSLASTHIFVDRYLLGRKIGRARRKHYEQPLGGLIANVCGRDRTPINGADGPAQVVAKRNPLMAWNEQNAIRVLEAGRRGLPASANRREAMDCHPDFPAATTARRTAATARQPIRTARKLRDSERSEGDDGREPALGLLRSALSALGRELESRQLQYFTLLVYERQ